MSFYRYFWYLKTAILGPWEVLEFCPFNLLWTLWMWMKKTCQLSEWPLGVHRRCCVIVGNASVGVATHHIQFYHQCTTRFTVFHQTTSQSTPAEGLSSSSVFQVQFLFNIFRRRHILRQLSFHNFVHVRAQVWIEIRPWSETVSASMVYRHFFGRLEIMPPFISGWLLKKVVFNEFYYLMSLSFNLWVYWKTCKLWCLLV